MPTSPRDRSSPNWRPRGEHLAGVCRFHFAESPLPQLLQPAMDGCLAHPQPRTDLAAARFPSAVAGPNARDSQSSSGKDAVAGRRFFGVGKTWRISFCGLIKNIYRRVSIIIQKYRLLSRAGEDLFFRMARRGSISGNSCFASGEIADVPLSKGEHGIANQFSLTHLMPVTSEESAVVREF